MVTGFLGTLKRDVSIRGEGPSAEMRASGKTVSFQDPGFLEAEIPRPAADRLAYNHVINHVDL